MRVLELKRVLSFFQKLGRKGDPLNDTYELRANEKNVSPSPVDIVGLLQKRGAWQLRGVFTVVCKESMLRLSAVPQLLMWMTIPSLSIDILF